MNINTIDSKLAQAGATYRHATAEIARLSLTGLALLAHREQPAAHAIELEWSDQGPCLTVSRLIDDSGHDLESDEFFDEALDYANGLDDSNGQIWQPLIPNFRPKAGGGFRLDIASVLSTARQDWRVG